MFELDENHVRLRAYEIWEQDGRPHGCEMQHWERAMREMQAGTAHPRPSKGAKRVRKTEEAVKKPRRKALKAAS